MTCLHTWTSGIKVVAQILILPWRIHKGPEQGWDPPLGSTYHPADMWEHKLSLLSSENSHWLQLICALTGKKPHELKMKISVMMCVCRLEYQRKRQRICTVHEKQFCWVMLSAGLTLRFKSSNTFFSPQQYNIDLKIKDGTVRINEHHAAPWLLCVSLQLSSTATAKFTRNKQCKKKMQSLSTKKLMGCEERTGNPSWRETQVTFGLNTDLKPQYCSSGNGERKWSDV